MDGRVDLDNLAKAVALVNALPSIEFQKAIAVLLSGRVLVRRLEGGAWIAITAAPGGPFVAGTMSFPRMVDRLNARPRRVVAP